MSFRLLVSCLLLIQFHPISVFSAAPGKLKLYDDYNCDVPSTIHPTVSLPLSVCLVTTGGEGLIIANLPSCNEGTANLLYYQDTACGVPVTDPGSSIVAENCMLLAEGQGLYDVKSVMFSCKAAEDNPQPTSTSTAVVSVVAGVATGSADDNGATSSTHSPAPTSSDHIESKTTAASATSAHPGASTPKSSTGTTINGSSNTTNNEASTTTSKPSSNSGLGMSNVIALGVGLGIGVPTIAIMLLTWLAPNFRHWLLRHCCCCCAKRKQPKLQ